MNPDMCQGISDAMKSLSDNDGKINNILEELGFYKEIELSSKKHPLIDSEIDFSASSLEGIAYFIYEQGRKDGINQKEEEVRETLRELIGIKEGSEIVNGL